MFSSRVQLMWKVEGRYASQILELHASQLMSYSLNNYVEPQGTSTHSY